MRRKQTMRRLPPQTRKLADALNRAEKAISQLNKMVEDMAEMERDNLAWLKRQEHYRLRNEIDPLAQHDEMKRQMLSKTGKDLF